MSAVKEITSVLKKHPWISAGTIWTTMRPKEPVVIYGKVDIPQSYLDRKRMLKQMFPEEDQTVRELLAEMENEGLVKHRIGRNTILKEWRLI